jgi:asparagine synthase (glutamine-hydrolysing)
MNTHVKHLLKRLASRAGLHDRAIDAFPKDTVDLIQEIQRRHLTYLSSAKIARLLHLCEAARRLDASGLVIEAGCALGGSAILLAKHKPRLCELRVYDVFATIPPPSARDDADVHTRYETISSGNAVGLGGDVYYGYQAHLYERVCRTFVEFGIEPNANGVQLIKGLVEDTLQVDRPVLLAHIDVDWYDPVTVCLERIVPKLSEHGAIVLDDYKDWSGCHKAVDDYFRARKHEFRFDLSGGNLVVTRATSAPAPHSPLVA